jgi:hypothetical protein
MATRDMLIAKQAFVKRIMLPVPVFTVPAGAGFGAPVVRRTVEIGADGAFHLAGITGGFTLAALALPGVEVKITESKSGYALFEDYVPLECFLSPGAVGNPLFNVFPFDMIVEAKGQLQLEFINRDAVNSSDVKLVFHGEKIINL